MDDWVTGIFDDGPAAEKALQALVSSGVSIHAVSALMTERTRRRDVTMSSARATRAPRTPSPRAAGSALRAVVAGLTGTGGIAVAGTVGAARALAVGPLAAAIAGAAAPDAGTPALSEALAASGMSEQRSRDLEKRLQAGNVVLAVRSDDAGAEIAESIFAAAAHDFSRDRE